MGSSPFTLIFNPAADRGGASRNWRGVRAELDGAGVRYDVLETTAPGHAIELARQAAGQGGAVVAAGGDGTVQEVANGLLEAANGSPTVPMGIIPIGSGNDFAKLVGVPQRSVAAAKHLVTARPRLVDVGRVGSRFFTNGVGIGFDGHVAVEARKVRRLRGIAIYGWALLKVLRDHRTPVMQLTLDGHQMPARPLTLITVGNGACHGGGFWICPDAEIDDGVFDICVADALTRTQLLRLIPRVMRGTHAGRPGIEFHQARRVRVTSTEPLPVHADGEIVAEAAHDIEIELLPKRLTVLA